MGSFHTYVCQRFGLVAKFNALSGTAYAATKTARSGVGCKRGAARRFTLIATLAIASTAASTATATAAFELDTSRPKQVRLTSYGGVLVQGNCYRCSGKVEIKRAGKGKQPTLGSAKIDDDRLGGLIVQLSKKGQKLVAKEKNGLKVEISGKASGGEQNGSDSIVRKALTPIQVADPCTVLTQEEVQGIIGRPVGPPAPGDPSIGRPSDTHTCVWTSTNFPLEFFAVSTSRGDFANPKYLFSDPGNVNDLETDVSGPWDFGRTFASSVEEDTSGDLRIIRGEDALVFDGYEQDFVRMIPAADDALGRYP